MSRLKTLATNTLIFGICNFTSKLLVFFMLPLYTAVLSKEEFGAADIVHSTVTLLQPLLTIAISEACMRYALDKACDTRQVLSIGLKTLLIGFVVLLVASPFFVKTPDIGPYIVYFILLYITTVLNNLFNYFGRGIQKVRLVGIAGIVSAFTAVASNLLLLFVFHLGVRGYLISMIVAQAAASLVLFIGGKMWQYMTLETEAEVTHSMIRYSAPLVPNRLSWWINHTSNRYIISNFCGVADVGLYSAAARMPAIVDTFRGIFIEAWQLSMITEYDKSNSNVFFNNIFRAYNVFMILLCSGLVMLSKVLGGILYSGSFFEAWIHTPILILSVFFGSLVAFYSPIYLAHKKTDKLFVFTLSGSIITLLLNFVLVPQIGIRGSAIASVVSYFAIYFVMALDSRKYLKLTADKIVFKITYVVLAIQSFLIAYGVISPIGWFSIFLFAVVVVLNFNDILSMIRTLLKVIYNKVVARKNKKTV